MSKNPFRYGCLWFASTEEPDSGIFSIAGSKAKMFDTIGELPSDVIWWSNVSYAACRTSSLGQMTNIRHNKYLILSPEECLNEWGYPAKTLTPEQCVVFSSRLFSRIMGIAYDLILESAPRRHNHQIFSTHDLRNDFAAILPRFTFPTGEAATVLKAGYSFVNYSSVAQRMPRGLARVQLRRPRLAHALDMLSTPVPDGEVAFISGRKTEHAYHEALNSEKPVLSEVSISNVDPSVGPVFAWGISMDRKSKVMRSWVPHPELISMSAFADIDVKNMWQAEKYSLLYESLPQAIINFLMSKYAPLSWSAGVIAETIWRACCLKNQMQTPTGEETPDTSWQGLWLKSSDKTVSFLSAMDMTSLGWQASSYGSGHIWFGCHITQVDKLIHDGFACGLIPRLDCIPASYTPKEMQWHGDKKSATMAALIANKKTDVLLSMDKIMTAPEGDRELLLGQVIKDMQKAG